MNPFSPEMHQYKNVEGKIIIIYDVDEFLATDCAHQMVQRGFENIFVVSTAIYKVRCVFPMANNVSVIGWPQTDSSKDSKWPNNRIISGRMLFISRQKNSNQKV